eukprot:IDg23791t1
MADALQMGLWFAFAALCSTHAVSECVPAGQPVRLGAGHHLVQADGAHALLLAVVANVGVGGSEGLDRRHGVQLGGRRSPALRERALQARECGCHAVFQRHGPGDDAAEAAELTREMRRRRAGCDTAHVHGRAAPPAERAVAAQAPSAATAADRRAAPGRPGGLRLRADYAVGMTLRHRSAPPTPARARPRAALAAIGAHQALLCRGQVVGSMGAWGRRKNFRITAGKNFRQTKLNCESASAPLVVPFLNSAATNKNTIRNRHLAVSNLEKRSLVPRTKWSGAYVEVCECGTESENR